MTSGIPFIKIADRVEVSVHLTAHRTSGRCAGSSISAQAARRGTKQQAHSRLVALCAMIRNSADLAAVGESVVREFLSSAKGTAACHQTAKCSPALWAARLTPRLFCAFLKSRPRPPAWHSPS